MKKTTRQLIDGLEASRRVGWARFYEKEGEYEALREENAKLKWVVRLLVRRIVFHSRLSNSDDLVVLAKELELSL